MSNIEQFKIQQDIYWTICKKHSFLTDKFNNYLNNKYKSIFTSKFGNKKKYKYSLIADLPETVILKEKIKLWADKFWLNWDNKKQIQKQKLFELAKNIDLTELKSDIFELWNTVGSYSYSTQGYGAIKYAQNAAENQADKARMYNLEVEIRRANEGNSGGTYCIPYCDFEIWVKCNKLALDILGYKDYPSIRDSVKMLLKRGSNPWVIYPFLPPGYMENERINWQGEDY